MEKDFGRAFNKLSSQETDRNGWWLCLPPLVNKSFYRSGERQLKRKTTHILFPVSAINFRKILRTLLILERKIPQLKYSMFS